MESKIQLDNYEGLDLLGKGGMGEVYRAHDPNLGRDVAIKLLPEALAADDALLGRLKREARALAALNHPHIATIHGLEEQSGTTFIVMELIEGPTLAERLCQGPIPIPEALDIARQIAGALAAAHQGGIVHRDLKPENIKIMPDGHVKVLDFGLAKRQTSPNAAAADSVLVTQTVEATRAGTVMGTPPYMSPEQIRAAAVDERTDVWAFGCVLYEMLTGKRAFGRETPSDTMAAILQEEPDDSLLPADLPDAVRQLLRGALAKDLDRRLSSIRDARVALEDSSQTLASGEQPAARSHGVPARAGGLAGVAGLALVAAAGWYFLASPAAPEISDRSIAVLPFDTLGQEQPTVFTEGVHVDMLTRLSQLPELRVTSRTSVMQYRTPDRPLPEIAAELGVTWILLGEVQEVGEQVQVSARLVNAVEDRQVWADSYRRALTAENLFDIQRELTERIAAQLQAQLTPEQREVVAAVPTRDLQAYRLYVQGRDLLNRRTAEDMRAAVGYFEQATARDPDYAMAWVGLADAFALLESYGHAPDEDLLPRGFEAVQKALDIAPQLAEAHASYGLLLAEGGAVAPAAALEELQRAVALRPSYAEAHNWMAWSFLLMGHPDRALTSARRAVELDPLSLEAVGNLALAEIAMGRYAEGLQESQRVGTLGPDYATGRLTEAVARLHLGDAETAGALLEGLEVPWAGTGPLSTLAVARARAGDTAGASMIVAELERSGHPFDAGLVHAALGRHEAAWAAFDRIEDWPAWPTLAARYLFPEDLGPFRADPRWVRVSPPRQEIGQN